MKMLTATLAGDLAAEDLAHACKIYHEAWSNCCPMGWFFKCPLQNQCEDVTAKDWEAIMQDVTAPEGKDNE